MKDRTVRAIIALTMLGSPILLVGVSLFVQGADWLRQYVTWYPPAVILGYYFGAKTSDQQRDTAE